MVRIIAPYALLCTRPRSPRGVHISRYWDRRPDVSWRFCETAKRRSGLGPRAQKTLFGARTMRRVGEDGGPWIYWFMSSEIVAGHRPQHGVVGKKGEERKRKKKRIHTYLYIYTEKNSHAPDRAGLVPRARRCRHRIYWCSKRIFFTRKPRREGQADFFCSRATRLASLAIVETAASHILSPRVRTVHGYALTLVSLYIPYARNVQRNRWIFTYR